MKIDIYGSCVSRDVLEYQETRTIEVNQYFARCSVISLASTPLEVALEDIVIPSKFRQRMVYHDFRKDAFRELQKNRGDYLLVDLIDERFSMIRTENSFVTCSNELLESKYFPEDMPRESVNGSLVEGYSFNGKSLEEYLIAFCDQIKSVYPCSRVILHKAYGCETYLENGTVCRFDDRQQKIWKKFNQRLDYMYAVLENNLFGCRVIDLRGRYMADAGHRWGLAPINYQKEYYEDVLKILQSIAAGSEKGAAASAEAVSSKELELFEALADCKRMNEDLTGILEKLREDTEAREGEYLREIGALKGRMADLKAEAAELKKQAAKAAPYKKLHTGEWLAMSESRMGRLLYKVFVLYRKCAKRLKGKG